MPSLIGNKPNQVPSNGDLGTLAFQDASNPKVGAVVADSLVVDTNTLVVDSVNDRVGIGTSSPSTKLDIVGAAKISEAVTAGQVIATSANPGHAASRLLLAWNAGVGQSQIWTYGSNDSTIGSLSFQARSSAGSLGGSMALMNQYGIGLVDAVPSSGTGITFPATQSASSNANTLDDYEEGTWTPAFTSTGLTVTQAISNGRYTKVGALVTASFYIQVTAISGTTTNGLFINNLPFATAGGSEYGYSSAIGVHQFSTAPSMFITAAATRLTLYQNGTVTSLTGANLNNGYYLGTVTYLVV